MPNEWVNKKNCFLLTSFYSLEPLLGVGRLSGLSDALNLWPRLWKHWGVGRLWHQCLVLQLFFTVTAIKLPWEGWDKRRRDENNGLSYSLQTRKLSWLERRRCVDAGAECGNSPYGWNKDSRGVTKAYSIFLPKDNANGNNKQTAPHFSFISFYLSFSCLWPS